jgi:bifunctional DNA-binding transcriptional regulator/antitoxin component of YhaV-PrlF toxin-antitoxin module
VIPQEIREQLGIKPNSRLAWSARDGVIVAIPMPDDPIEASLGMLAGKGYTFEDFIRDRQEDREFERRLEERQEAGFKKALAERAKAQ